MQSSPDSEKKSGNPALAGPLQIFKCFLIHATAGPHARNCPRAKSRQAYPEKAELFRRNPPRRMRWQENMRCAELVEARCQGVACAKPAWRQTGLDIYFLVRQLADWDFLFQDKKDN